MADPATSPTTGSATDTAVAVVAALRQGGVRDVVLAPGSRSSALAVAFHQADAEGLLRLHVRIDERTAGFLALGLAKGSHKPVAVATTSGTAVANLHPAVLEAWHVGEALIVLAADRPAALRGTGANQTTDQVGIFGPRVACFDVAAGDAEGAGRAVTAATRARRPTHVNLQLVEPLLPPALPVDLSLARRPLPHHQILRAQLVRPDGSVRLDRGPRTVVVAGDDAGPPARLMAQDANWPLLAEPTSGARTGTHALRCGRLLLDGPLAAQVERVIVTGHPTLSRPVTRLISRPDIEVVTVPAPSGVATDPGRVARHLPALPVVDGADPDDWIDAWRAADADVSSRLDALVASDDDTALPLRVAAEVAAAVVPEALLVVGSSSPIRDLDLMMPPYAAGGRRLIIANRGLAGIDGTVSTALGAALGRRGSRALAYVGDLTLLHDSNGLILGPDEPRPDLTIVVANDDGGSIFETLESGDAAYREAFERVYGTPHGVRFRALCRATGTAYSQATTAEELRALLAEETTGLRVIEVPLDRSTRRALAERVLALEPRN